MAQRFVKIDEDGNGNCGPAALASYLNHTKSDRLRKRALFAIQRASPAQKFNGVYTPTDIRAIVAWILEHHDELDYATNNEGHSSSDSSPIIPREEYIRLVRDTNRDFGDLEVTRFLAYFEIPCMVYKVSEVKASGLHIVMGVPYLGEQHLDTLYLLHFGDTGGSRGGHYVRIIESNDPANSIEVHLVDLIVKADYPRLREEVPPRQTLKSAPVPTLPALTALTAPAVDPQAGEIKVLLADLGSALVTKIEDNSDDQTITLNKNALTELSSYLINADFTNIGELRRNLLDSVGRIKQSVDIRPVATLKPPVITTTTTSTMTTTTTTTTTSTMTTTTTTPVTTTPVTTTPVTTTPVTTTPVTTTPVTTTPVTTTPVTTTPVTTTPVTTAPASATKTDTVVKNRLTTQFWKDVYATGCVPKDFNPTVERIEKFEELHKYFSSGVVTARSVEISFKYVR